MSFNIIPNFLKPLRISEYLNAKMIASYLDYDFIDAANIIVFNEKGKFKVDATDKKIREVLKNHKTAVIPGFYGAMPGGKIKTFSRGGSDVTGALIARAMGARYVVRIFL